ncbi:MAG: PepSY domain-containing protein [Pseudomonadota bacterium]|nr:PepSY domain-containing protein [Pseudomonadota bacterium]
MFKKTLVLLTLAITPTAVMAGADCVANPKAEWKSEADARAKFEADGYKIKKFKVDGDCYEIYGFTKDGKKAEIYFDTKTLEIVKSEIDD